MKFTDLQNVCKYSASAYDADKNIIGVCINPKAISQIGVWGVCDAERCPLMEDERNDANEMPCSP